VQHLFTVPLLVVLGAVLFAAIVDLWKYKIHNVVTIPLLISGVIYHAVSPDGNGVAQSLLGAFFGMATLGVFYCMGGMGAGDVKLLAAIGAWLCLPLTFWVFIASSLATGVYAIILILAYGRVAQTWVNLRIIYYRMTTVARHLGAEDHVEEAVKQDDRRKRVIPFAAMVAVGLIALLAVAWYGGNLDARVPSRTEISTPDTEQNEGA
jgi:prepilin peptidase CpaA